MLSNSTTASPDQHTKMYAHNLFVSQHLHYFALEMSCKVIAPYSMIYKKPHFYVLLIRFSSFPVVLLWCLIYPFFLKNFKQLKLPRYNLYPVTSKQYTVHYTVYPKVCAHLTITVVYNSNIPFQLQPPDWLF